MNKKENQKGNYYNEKTDQSISLVHVRGESQE